MALLFRKTRELEGQIDQYLDWVVRGGLLFKQGIKFYLEFRGEEFEERLKDLKGIETKADHLRRDIESKLYIETLIPEARGDVLGLMESTDKVLNRTAETLLQFSVELPEIPEQLRPLYLDLAETSVNALESMVTAIRAYFRDFSAVRDHIAKVSAHETESDRIGERIKRIVFREKLDLAHKMHLGQMAYHIERIADEAEDVCDRLGIAAIKRHM